MSINNGVDPNQLFVSPLQALEIIGCDRNELRGLMLKKQLEWDMVAGKTLLYRASVELYKDKLNNASKPRNPYERKEASCSAT